jgi:hypothetical protein
MTNPDDGAQRPPQWVSPGGSPAAPPASPVPAAQPVPPVAPGGGQWGAPPAPPGWQQPTGWGAPPPAPVWRPQALQPGIVPLRPLGLGEILDGAFRAVRANPAVMFGLAALVVTVGVVLSDIVSWYLRGFIDDQVSSLFSDAGATGTVETTGQLSQTLSELAGLPLVSLATTVLSGLVIVSVSRSVLGRKVTIGEVLRSPRVWWVVGFTILAALTVSVVSGVLVGVVVLLATSNAPVAAVLVGLLGGIALVVGAIWFAVRTLLVPAALMLEGKSFWRTVRRAWRLTRGSFWRLLGIYLLASFIVGVIGQFIVGPANAVILLVMNGDTESFASIALRSVASIVAYMLSGVFTAAVVALLYIDVRMRREGLDVELARAARSGA